MEKHELPSSDHLADIVKLRGMEKLYVAAERARSNLSRYFSPNIVGILAAQDDSVGIMHRQTVAVLFVDIIGFTRMVETMPLEAVVLLLRQFHERMTAQISVCNGIVEKYIGDEIFAVFGVPTPSDKDAANALICADLMLKALDCWNMERTRDGETTLAIGIGLNYGPVILGDVGSKQSMSFMVIGDTVNTASRLQEMTRTLKTPLVVGGPLVDAISEETSETVAALVGELQDQGEQPLRGHDSLIRIWVRRTSGRVTADAFSTPSDCGCAFHAPSGETGFERPLSCPELITHLLHFVGHKIPILYPQAA